MSEGAPRATQLPHDHVAVARVPIRDVLVAGTPRLMGEDPEHIRLMADLGDVLPPIIVHRSSMRVLDGIHRLRAAQSRGDTHIDVTFFDGDEQTAFVVSVQANIAHGRPLTFADRTAAAERILGTHPQWSDRTIARHTGLAAKTVADIRRRSTVDGPQLHTRIGRDGRSRPVDAAAARARVARFLAERPEASLREIARLAGVSPSTVRNVRARPDEGRETQVTTLRRADGDLSRDDADGLGSLIVNLRNDPSVRFSESGRNLLRLLSSQPTASAAWRDIARTTPTHCAEMVARIAKQHAANWERFADELSGSHTA